jgi:outer membrane protein TolC
MDKHTPDPGFLDRLEARVVTEARRQRQAPAPPSGWMASRLRLAVAAATIAAVSMGVGAASVMAAYELQTNEQRTLLSQDLQRRIDLERQRLQLAAADLQRRQTQVSIGVATPADVAGARAKVTDAEAAVQLLQLQLEEVRVTGHDPVDSLSAPLLSGRDFVAERLKVTADNQTATLQTVQNQLADAQRRFQVGLAGDIDVTAARTRLLQAEALLTLTRTKLELRRQVDANQLPAAQADLRVLEAEAQQRQAALRAQLVEVQARMMLVSKQVSTGQAQSVELAEARLNVQQIQTDLAKAELDVELVRRQLAAGKGGGS